VNSQMIRCGPTVSRNQPQSDTFWLSRRFLLTRTLRQFSRTDMVSSRNLNGSVALSSPDRNCNFSHQIHKIYNKELAELQ
jgi:hypothetical protein